MLPLDLHCVTVIPLTTKRKNDGRWYHVDLEDRNHTAICEQLKVISRARLHVPYRNKGGKHRRIAEISKSDRERIPSVLQRLYTIDIHEDDCSIDTMSWRGYNKAT
ncbi:type II toxin-antitoxin system PemK/MazF family toxin [Thermoactinomyces vulgaris]|uniref:Type II toxin-antitoxin system PemK/MazF family toxin n=1 Tax=Thermoactinomyces vulgaris TaxID=2026 RepID=A0ABS0QD51_THEVU|nr:type II toxin-antitoxin system PemK/MazF family toxin [Thermoactinomyces vulgaris]MBA4596006.1 type II toxin-antitoxin system PemK/MazF family toxin [Thermoactinomyces vulgaris]MBH8587209.1 type II toxin-antitoxin system PemK/MazF family toxin [Thermoactinomyces vulgaris]